MKSMAGPGEGSKSGLCNLLLMARIEQKNTIKDERLYLRDE